MNRNNEVMAAKAITTSRAPRGTKTLTQAFFSAADGIPETQRAAVIKAAVAAIRDQLKEVREKAKAVKVKAKEKASKASAGRGPKLSKPPTKNPTAVSAASKTKVTAKASRRSQPPPVPAPTPEVDTV